MQALGAAQYCGEGLDGYANYVVVRLLGGEGTAAGLGVKAKPPALGVSRAEPLAHELCPEAAGGTELGHLLQKVVVGVEEEADLGGEQVYIKPDVDRLLNVFDSVGDCEGDFLDGAAAGFADVISADRYGVPSGQMPGAVEKEVGHQTHGGRGREDVGAAGDVLLEDVVLYCAAQFLRGYALLAGDGNNHCQEDRSRRVDRHADADFIQGDATEKRAHVLQAADGDAYFAHFALGEVVVGVIADLGGEIEGD